MDFPFFHVFFLEELEKCGYYGIIRFIPIIYQPSRLRADMASQKRKNGGRLEARVAPAYERVYEKLRHLISGSDIGEGQFLPSEARLASDLDTNKCTLRQALLMLKNDGCLVSVPSKGWRLSSKSGFGTSGSARKDAVVLLLGPASGPSTLTLRAAKRELESSGRIVDLEILSDFEFEASLGSPAFAKEKNFSSALVFSDIALPSAFVAALRKLGRRIVCAGHQKQASEYECVATDNAYSSRLIIDSLLSRSVKKVAFIGDFGTDAKIPSFRTRRLSLSDCASESGIAYSECLLEYNSLLSLPNRAKLGAFLSSESDSRDGLGLVFSNEGIAFEAIGVLDLFMERFSGLNISYYGSRSRLKVLGAMEKKIRVTAVEEDWEEIGLRSAEQLILLDRNPGKKSGLQLVKSFIDEKS